MTVATRPLPLTDLVYGILGFTFLRHKDVTQIARDHVYSGLKALSERYPEYFPSLYFTDRGDLKHSKQVEDALFRLAGVLAVKNPRYQYLSFNENQLPHVETKTKNWFDASTRAVVEKLAEEFYVVVKAP